MTATADPAGCPVELRGLEPLAFWMQTMGMILVAIKRSSSVRMSMPARDGCSAHRLLYLAAVRDGRHKGK